MSANEYLAFNGPQKIGSGFDDRWHDLEISNKLTLARMPENERSRRPLCVFLCDVIAWAFALSFGVVSPFS